MIQNRTAKLTTDIKLTQHDVTSVADIWLASIALPNAASASLRSCTAYWCSLAVLRLPHSCKKASNQISFTCNDVDIHIHTSTHTSTHKHKHMQTCTHTHQRNKHDWRKKCENKNNNTDMIMVMNTNSYRPVCKYSAAISLSTRTTLCERKHSLYLEITRRVKKTNTCGHIARWDLQL